jgi:hypothetical protein
MALADNTEQTPPREKVHTTPGPEQPTAEAGDGKPVVVRKPRLRVNDNYLKLGIANDAFVGSAPQR